MYKKYMNLKLVLMKFQHIVITTGGGCNLLFYATTDNFFLYWMNSLGGLQNT